MDIVHYRQDCKTLLKLTTLPCCVVMPFDLPDSRSSDNADFVKWISCKFGTKSRWHVIHGFGPYTADNRDDKQLESILLSKKRTWPSPMRLLLPVSFSTHGLVAFAYVLLKMEMRTSNFGRSYWVYFFDEPEDLLCDLGDDCISCCFEFFRTPWVHTLK